MAEGRHRAFKLKIGARELATDLRHTRAIVEALGDRASIRVDVNQAWDAATGAKGCRELAAMGVDLIEQPVSAQDNAATVRLSQQVKPRSSRMKRSRPLTMVISWRSGALPALTR